MVTVRILGTDGRTRKTRIKSKKGYTKHSKNNKTYYKKRKEIYPSETKTLGFTGDHRKVITYRIPLRRRGNTPQNIKQAIDKARAIHKTIFKRHPKYTRAITKISLVPDRILKKEIRAQAGDRGFSSPYHTRDPETTKTVLDQLEAKMLENLDEDTEEFYEGRDEYKDLRNLKYLTITVSTP